MYIYSINLRAALFLGVYASGTKKSPGLTQAEVLKTKQHFIHGLKTGQTGINSDLSGSCAVQHLPEDPSGYWTNAVRALVGGYDFQLSYNQDGSVLVECIDSCTHNNRNQWLKIFGIPVIHETWLVCLNVWGAFETHWSFELTSEEAAQLPL